MCESAPSGAIVVAGSDCRDRPSGAVSSVAGLSEAGKRRPASLRPATEETRSIGGARLDESVKEQFERPVRLSAEEDLRAVQDEPAFAHLGLGDRDPAVEVLLAPRPATAERRLAV